MLMDMYLPKFDIYQNEVALNCFKSHIKSWTFEFFLKKMFCLRRLTGFLICLCES